MPFDVTLLLLLSGSPPDCAVIAPATSRRSRPHNPREGRDHRRTGIPAWFHDLVWQSRMVVTAAAMARSLAPWPLETPIASRRHSGERALWSGHERAATPRTDHTPRTASPGGERMCTQNTFLKTLRSTQATSACARRNSACFCFAASPCTALGPPTPTALSQADLLTCSITPPPRWSCPATFRHA